jgi:ubiquinone/menaquinone biosynthesis C-methylase UbiE
VATSGTHKLLDLGSGGAEQIAMLIKHAKRQGLSTTQFVLSDLYPNVTTWQALQRQFGEDSFSYMEQPLSALDMRGVGLRHWSIFSAFHHFAPQDVEKILQQLIQNGDGLCITEFTKRRWFDLAPMILALPVHLVVPFFAKKFKWSKLLFTTIIPIVPLMASFDGIVSVLRSYEKEEIIALIPSEHRDQFDVQYKEVWWRFSPLKATMLTLSRKK